MHPHLGTYPFSTYASAQAAYRATIERLGLGASEAPIYEVLDEAGNLARGGLQRAGGLCSRTDRIASQAAAPTRFGTMRRG